MPENLLHTQRVDALYAHLLPALGAAVSISLLLAWVFDGVLAPAPLYGWLATVWGLVLVQLGVWVAYQRQRRWSTPGPGWVRTAVALTGLAGIAWGLGLGWMALAGNPVQALIAISMGLGAISLTIANLAYWQNHAAFQVPVLLCMGVAAWWSPQPGFKVLSVASLVLCGAQFVIAIRLNRTYLTAWRVSIENRRLVDELRVRGDELDRLSRTDALTGIANRRAYSDRLQQEWARSQRLRQRLSLVAIDVDHFKRYNDTHGHGAGDQCLKLVAKLLASGIRQDLDLAARPGGEEFAVLLPDTGQAQALVVANRLRAAIEAASAAPGSGLPGGVTASLGVATLEPGHPGTAEQLAEEADRALYAAKEAGRNRVAAAQWESWTPAPAPAMGF